MLKRILIIVLVVLFIVLGYFGMQQMQMTNQLKENLATATQQVDSLKQTNMDLETAKVSANKKVDDLNMALQNLQKQIGDLQMNAAAQVAMLTKLTEDNKTAHAKITTLSDLNKKLETERKAMENRFQAQIQVSEIRIKALSDKLQHVEPASGQAAIVSAPIKVMSAPAGIGAKL